MKLSATPTTPEKFDVLIVGGGLAGCLLFHFLKKHHPLWKVALIEQKNEICGSHTWSLHFSDIPPALFEEMKSLFSASWSEYDVYFPKYHRHISSGYASIRSVDLKNKTESLADDNFQIRTGCKVRSISTDAVETDSSLLQGQWVIDARGWGVLTGPLGYQKFLGQEVEFEKPHGLNFPIIKDARVEQTDGYRFFYVLPLTSHRLLIEDTYYSNSPDLDLDTWRSAIKSYANQHYGAFAKVLHEEVGCLPLALTPQKEASAVLRLGARSQFYQPVTGYSLPQTLKSIDFILKELALDSCVTSTLDKHRRFLQNHDMQFRYLFGLNRMLFLAAQPEKRYKVLERFYQLPEDLIHRFYRGELTPSDQLRILWGKPPVALLPALKALLLRA